MIIYYIKKILLTSINLLNGASTWLIFSFILAGLLHNILAPDKFQKMLGNKKISSLIKATLSGMLLPICSCGVIPLGLSLYYSGAYLGPTLAFIASTPIINPIAVFLSYGLLGPKIATIYLVVGFTVPLIIGVIGNKLGGPELKAPGVEEQIQKRMEEIELEEDQTSIFEKIKMGILWSFSDVAVAVSKYVIPGMVLAGILLVLVPQEFIQQYLGSPNAVSILGIAVIGCIMYVCAVGHIPFIAALVASGAAPGIAITFLMAGTASNLPELISIGKLIGKRTVAIYTTTLIALSFIVGYFTNIILPNFEPVISFDRTQNTIKAANKFIFAAPEPMKYVCSLIMFVLFLKAMLPKVKKISKAISA
ncbi:permease [Clostridium botulinum]|nr:permease [Clostridium botulinum]